MHKTQLGMPTLSLSIFSSSSAHAWKKQDIKHFSFQELLFSDVANIRNTVLTKCNSNVFRLTPKHYIARYPAAHGSVNCLIQGHVQIYCYTSISRQDATKSTVSNMNFSCHDLVHLSPEATTQRLLELASTVPHPVMILKPSTHCTCFSSQSILWGACQ